ncbi:dynein light chain [Venturia nashicola]|uniref:Dynein light chain n=1 Tax=Venturia nashicola TaxID=86259 RepID=A0A4Z1PG41_9PEZI|nr:dynein light chain [Venturia nashicola]
MALEKSEEKLEAQVKAADMSEDMQHEAIEVAQDAMQKFNIEKEIAQFIKKEFDQRKGATWHCIVGRNFGSFVTHGMKLTFLQAPCIAAKNFL